MKIQNQFLWLIRNTLSELEVVATLKQLDVIESDGSFTLGDLTQTLTWFRIDSLGVMLSPSQLEEIPLPAIIQNTKNGFYVLQRVSNFEVEYLSFEDGKIVKPIEAFRYEWTGVALLVEKTSKSGEPNYALNRRLEILENVRKGAVYVLLALLLTALCWFWPSFIFPILLLAGGIGLSVALLKQTLGQETILGQAVCKAGTTTDCNKVINSKLAKVYGDISLAEIALLFFACAMGSHVSSLASGQGYNFLLGWLSLAALPVTMLSIYYQWRVLKTWCLLCLGVVGSIWGLAGFYGYHINDWSYGWPAIQAFAVGVAVPLLVWFLVRTSIIQSARVPGLEKGLNKFRKSLSVFQALSAQKPEIHPEVYAGDVVLGHKEANNTITIVTNPTCGPCVRAHQFIESCLEEHGENLKVVFRFAVNPADTGTSGTVAKHLISLGLNDNEQLNAAMHAWYATEKLKLQEWLDRFPTESHPEAQDRLAQHSNWCRANQINATPTIFFNGRQIPEEFSLQDFEYFLRLKMAEVEMEMAEA